MNQLKPAFRFTNLNIMYFMTLALPVIAIDAVLFYLISPIGLMIPDDMILYLQDNWIIFMIVSITGIYLKIAYVGGLSLSINCIENNEGISPTKALQYGGRKFIILLGCMIITGFFITIGFLLLILPGLYLTARFSLVPFYVMLENKQIGSSIKSSWENTDEYGGRLFQYILFFTVFEIVLALLFGALIPDGIFNTVLISIVQYILIVPLYYIYFSLYKSVTD